MKFREIKSIDQTVKVNVILSWRELVKIGLVVGVVQVVLHRPVDKETYDKAVNKASEFSEKVVDKIVDKFGGEDDESPA
jgi:hypothetical protein